MANKRMFSKQVTQTDQFLDLPLSAQSLYFHLNMQGDDDGFLNNYKMTMRMIGASKEDLQALIDSAFIINFASGVICIRHWKLNNTLQNDRYSETLFQGEFAQVEERNKVYFLKSNDDDSQWNQIGSKMDPQHNITEHNIAKPNLTESSIAKNNVTEKNQHNQTKINQGKQSDQVGQDIEDKANDSSSHYGEICKALKRDYLDYINQSLGTQFSNDEENSKVLNGLYNDYGQSREQLMKVIKQKVNEWQGISSVPKTLQAIFS
ncbi:MULTISPECIES: conserved phage C-terminal domain-containing protein [Aerococcus]|nr:MULTISPECIES: conserved phage C-terminal domain-containing protein [Aerococcus]MCY3034904.1 conserved phage C-terminal domain-containing protein [Aerococcus mictus]MCY3063358.1 conserved phage C-terminal domain-containing protein [Aerococcus mictus]MCY3075290.1 conserved phage C-terminal domain-containing protein [Aerococcus mictus]MCY3080742.1 conserved phage C-terminal domain-containing protein [Aerococcus mictus]MCY3082688.1 conserved phage C-terminal domain-containing protein [Aerococcu